MAVQLRLRERKRGRVGDSARGGPFVACSSRIRNLHPPLEKKVKRSRSPSLLPFQPASTTRARLSLHAGLL